MISNLLMASGKNSVSTVDMVDPFGDNSGVALYKFDGDVIGYGALQDAYNSMPWQQQSDFNNTQSGNISGWTIDGSVPSLNAEQETYTFMAKNKAYIINSKEKSVFVADINTQGDIGSFSLHSTLPTAMCGSVFFTTPTKVYLYNSWYDNISASYYATIGSDGTLSSWNTGTAFPLTLRGAMTFSYGGYVYVCGGHHSTTFTPNCYYAPINTDGTVGTWSSTSALPNYKTDGCVLITKGRVYLVGGYDASNNTGLTNTTTFNIDGTLASWSTVTSAPTGLTRATAIATNTSAYYFGGLTTGSTPHASCYTAPIDTNGVLGSWTLMGTFPKTIAYYGMLITSSKLYLIGGKQDGVYSADIYSASFVGGMNDYSDELVTQEPVNYSSTATNVTYGTGKFGQCGVFNGSNTLIDTGIPQSALTVSSFSVWVYPLSGSSYKGVFGDHYGVFSGIAGFQYAGGISQFMYGTGSTYINGNVSISLNTWTHLVGIITGTGLQIYKNGLHVTSVSGGALSPMGNIFVGRAFAAADRYWNGSIDNFRIFNRALTQEEVTALYEESVDSYTPYVAPPQPIGIIPEANLVAFYPLDTDARDDFSTYEGTASSVTFDGTKAVFNGSSSYINASTTAIPNGVFSVSAWVQFASLANEQRFIALNDSATDRYFRIAKPTTNKLIVSFGVLSANTISSTTDCIINQWYHTVFIKDTATISLFVDGALIGSVASTGYADMTSSGSSLHFGCSRDVGDEHLNGSMSRVAIFNKALSQEEVTALYNEGQS